MPSDTISSVSVIVPVRNEEHFIERTLTQLLQQDRTGIDVEILVVDGESTDQTAAIVRRLAMQHDEIRLFDNPRRLSSAARNVGIRNSSGAVVLIIDGHCELPDGQHLQKVVRAFEVSRADCLGRPQPLDVSGATPLQQAIGLARASRLGHHPESFIYSAEPLFVPAKSVAVAYRRHVFERVGLFDERFDAHEDGEFNYRVDQAGLKCYFSPDIAVKYSPRSSLRGLFRQMMRYGRGRVRFSRKHPGTWGVGSMIPALFCLFLVFGGLAAAVFPAWRVAYLAGISAYALIIAGYSIAITVHWRRVRLFHWLPIVFFVVHLGAGIGLLTEILAPARRSRT